MGFSRTLSRTCLRRYVALAVACLCMALVGSYLLMSIMSTDMQEEFSLTQTAVEIIAGLGSATGNLGYPWGLLLEHMSERRAYLLAIVLGATCSFALYAGDFFISVYSANWWLIAILWGGVCSSFVISYLVTTAVSLGNFPRHQHGRVMGLLTVVWSLGQAFFDYLYTVCQQHHPPRVGTIFLVIGICTLLFKGMGAIFVHPIPLDPEEEKNLLEVEKSEKSAEPEREPHDGSEKEGWLDALGLWLLCDLDFHLIVWGFMLGVSVQVMYISNVASIGKVLDLGMIDEKILPYAPLFGMAVSFTVGILSDLTLHKCPRESYIAVAGGLQTLLFGVSTVYAENQAIFIATVLLIFGFNATYFGLTGTILGDYFGMKHFKRNWGIAMMCSSLVAFLLTTAYGTLLDAAATPDGECIGIECLEDIFIIGGFMSFLSFIAMVWLHRRFVKERRNRNKISSE